MSRWPTGASRLVHALVRQFAVPDLPFIVQSPRVVHPHGPLGQGAKSDIDNSGPWFSGSAELVLLVFTPRNSRLNRQPSARGE